MIEKRPWGSYKVLSKGNLYKLKSIIVNSNSRISYQYHVHRSENWTIIRGNAEVTIDDVKHNLSPGESITIPKGARHRIKNIGNSKLEFIEVQYGDYLEEDDIVRIQDDYNRK